MKTRWTVNKWRINFWIRARKILNNNRKFNRKYKYWATKLKALNKAKKRLLSKINNLLTNKNLQINNKYKIKTYSKWVKNKRMQNQSYNKEDSNNNPFS